MSRYNICCLPGKVTTTCWSHDLARPHGQARSLVLIFQQNLLELFQIVSFGNLSCNLKKFLGFFNDGIGTRF